MPIISAIYRGVPKPDSQPGNGTTVKPGSGGVRWLLSAKSAQPDARLKQRPRRGIKQGAILGIAKRRRGEQKGRDVQKDAEIGKVRQPSIARVQQLIVRE